ncbi:MAG TPA: DUF4124 domain-containing protein [Gammaproteobacteria bacterium]
MHTISRSAPWLAAGLLLAALPLAAGAAMYRWVDEQGNTHFGDKIPAEYAKQDTVKEEVDERGFTVKIVQEKQKTPEQLAEEKRQREQQRHDELLLNTYDSVNGLELARDGKINSLESQIFVANAQIKEREDLIGRQQKRAADLERSGKPIDQKLQADMETTREQIRRNQEKVAALRAEQERIRAVYDADIARYKELKNIK